MPDTFRPSTDSGYGSRTSQKDRISTESQHLQYVFAVTDTAIDENRQPAFNGISYARQHIRRTCHAVEDTAAVIADDNAFCSGIGTGNGFFRRHDAFYDERQLDGFHDFCNITSTLRSYWLAKDAHIDQCRRINIAGNGEGAGSFRFMGFFYDFVIAAGFDRRDDYARAFLTGSNTRSIHIRSSTVSSKAQRTCVHGALCHGFIIFLFYCSRITVYLGIQNNPTDRCNKYRHTQFASQYLTARIRFILSGHAAHDQAVFLQCFHIAHK